MEFVREDQVSVQELIQLRLDFLNEDLGALSDEQQQQIRRQLKDYCEKHIPAGDFLAVLGMEKGKIASCAFLVINEKPANPFFLNGITATVLNVMTYPQYRRMGFSKLVMAKLIEYAKEKGVSSIDLCATKRGKPLYEKLGFETVSNTYMRKSL